MSAYSTTQYIVEINVKEYKKILIWSDGGSRGNPGPAGIGFVIKDSGNKLIYERGDVIGEATNNIAEYSAVLEALKYVKKNIATSEINCMCDSELIVKQLRGEYKVKNAKLKQLFYDIRSKLMEVGANISFTHVPRDKNERADELYNKALEQKLGLHKSKK
ncbi:ribonuclease H [Candidatus Berkelbacteria bacterium CG10_big_fil_rev_8_21_14_0_10_41_12]|uniref:Ribonuclease H n=1 Tax=Candidatus Berkelbacteria bacterium CG10_big_fil_rev_8_21_14_0_10_41_12 TaxID=1974513 RepID=A0A2M6WXP1_9BACT|nr:MAG: ribonuclease H [Candidatus Berkelbacteria bacterium CG10_big_fil_rev_8_21_14_0_10_41_12]